MSGPKRLSIVAIFVMALLALSLATACEGEPTSPSAKDTSPPPSASSTETTPPASQPATTTSEPTSTAPETTMTTTPTTTTTTSTTATTPTAEQQEYRDLLAKAVKNISSVNSYKFTMDMNMVTVVTGGSNPGSFTMRLTADGVSNSADKELQMNMNMSIDSDAPDFPEDMENINMQMYKVADWLYIKMDMPFLGEQWIKAPVDEDIEKNYDLNLIDEQLALLGSPGKIEPLREETIDGSLCEVMNIFPDTEALFEWIQEQDSSDVEMDLDKLDMMAETFKDFSFLVWITKDTRQIKKITLDMTMETGPDQLGNGKADFDLMTMDISMNMRIYDYNEPVTITLPPEAEDAIEISGDGELPGV